VQNTTQQPSVSTNSPVLPERSNVFDVGVVHTILPGLEVGLETYYKSARDLLDDPDEFIDRDHLLAPEVDRLFDRRVHDPLGSLDAVVDVHEAAGLLAISPDLDLVPTGELGLRDLPADRGGRLLPSAGPGAVRAVDVVVARNASE